MERLGLEGSEVGPLPHGRGKFGVLIWQHPLTLKPPIKIYKKALKSAKARIKQYRTIVAHTRRCASVRIVFVVFCVHIFACLIRRMPPPTFNDTAITNPHSNTTIYQLRAHWVQISWSIGSEKSFGHVPLKGVEPSTSYVQGEHPIHYVTA